MKNQSDSVFKFASKVRQDTLFDGALAPYGIKPAEAAGVNGGGEVVAKLIDPETARGTWMYEDPFDRITPGQVIDQLKTATWFAVGENGYLQKCEIGDLTFYRHPDGCCNCADGGLWISALFDSPEAAASWSDAWDGAEELFRQLNPPTGKGGNLVPMKH